jgi:hypothetical protein
MKFLSVKECGGFTAIGQGLCFETGRPQDLGDEFARRCMSIQDEMGETWLLARSRALSEERMKHEGYERKKQKQMYQQASDVKHDVT